MIEYRNISITLGGRKILDDVSLNVAAGDICCVVGRSGAGKSVMIKQLVGLLHPEQGEIFFDGTKVTGLDDTGLASVRRRCQMVFQHATLFDSLSCIENVALPIVKHSGVRPHKAREKALMVMTQVGVDHLADRYPAMIGPGLRKLVAIARALTMEPSAILFDEPTTGLDPIAARKFDALVKGPLARSGVTQVVVSHDVRSIFEIARKIALLDQGKLRFVGTPAELAQSNDPVVHGFIRGIPAEN